METRVGATTVHHVEHGAGRPVLVLHGACVAHREPEACFEPVVEAVAGFRRIYPDLLGMGRPAAPDEMRGAEDVLEALLAFAEAVTGGTSYLLIGHSAGGYHVQAMAARTPAKVAGLALLCPLLPGVRHVAPGAALADRAALERIGERWEIPPAPGPAYAVLDLTEHSPGAGPGQVVAG